MNSFNSFLILFGAFNLALFIFHRPLARLLAKYFPARPQLTQSDARVFLISTGIINTLGCCGFWLLSIFMHDKVTDHFQTRAEAERGHLFQRGWLPEIIPPSSYDITTTNNLDLNTSHGQFSYLRKDHSRFLAHLTRDQSLDNPPAIGYTFKKWTFLINDQNNHCLYRYQ